MAEACVAAEPSPSWEDACEAASLVWVVGPVVRILGRNEPGDLGTSGPRSPHL